MPAHTSIHLRGADAVHAAFVNVSGEIDTSTAKAFREQIFSALKDRAVRSVIVRLKHVPYMDSSGVAVLLELFKATHQRHVKLSLLEPSEATQQALDMVDFAALTPVYGSLRECAECTGITISSLRSGLDLNERSAIADPRDSEDARETRRA